MAKKINFNVVFITDEDPDYPSSELNTHGPAVRGWRSNPLNTHLNPKDIILRFHRPAKICRIQVLVHQFMIPEKIELWSHYSTKDTASTPSSQSYDYLGFFALSDNASTDFKSRELQSVLVEPKIGTHLKLRLSCCHPNDLNHTKQVSLIAINVIGFDLDASEFNTHQNGIKNLTELEDYPLVSICDDLSFSMYVEESIADVIREMEIKKQRAIKDERFEYARKLKICMVALRSAGERLGRYSLAKRQAVQQEDFTVAKLRKEQIELYRNDVIRFLLVDQLLEKDEILLPENDKLCEIYSQKPTLPSPPSLQDVANILNNSTPSSKSSVSENVESPKSVKEFKSSPKLIPKQEVPQSPRLSLIGRSPKNGSPNVRRRNRSVPRIDDYDEQAIPTMRHSHTNEFLRECQQNASYMDFDHRSRSKMNDRERRQAAMPILILGLELVESFYSRQFQDREEGLNRLRKILKGEHNLDTSGNINKLARSAAFLLHRAVRDAVFSVFNQAVETVRALFHDFIPDRVAPSEVARCTDRLLPELLARSGDPSPRIHTLAQHTILSIASVPEVREQHLVAPALSRAVGNGTHPRLALSRIQMLEQLVLSQGISQDKQSGLTCRGLAECGSSGIHHPAEPVRKVAERVLLLVYKVNPRLVRKHLPPDDDVTRRNLLYRQLFTEFDKIDMERKKDMFMNQSMIPSVAKMRLEQRDMSGNSSPVHRRQLTSILKSKSGDAIHKQLKNGISAKEQSKYHSPDDEIKCTFCNLNCSFAELDAHYWNVCPYLIRCTHCGQVVEISTLYDHYLNDCEAKLDFFKCKKCNEAVHKELEEYHVIEDCEGMKPNIIRCPLCHDFVEKVGKNSWKTHLLTDTGCSENPRKLYN